MLYNIHKNKSAPNRDTDSFLIWGSPPAPETRDLATKLNDMLASLPRPEGGTMSGD